MFAFVAGCFAGATLGFLLAGLVRGGHECECQVPTLGAGTWLVGIDQHGELVRVEPHACMEQAFLRLEEAMRKDEL